MLIHVHVHCASTSASGGGGTGASKANEKVAEAGASNLSHKNDEDDANEQSKLDNIKIDRWFE